MVETQVLKVISGHEQRIEQRTNGWGVRRIGLGHKGLVREGGRLDEVLAMCGRQHLV